MEMVRKLETTVGGFFKDLPALPASAKDSLVKAWPILALVFGILQLVAAYWLWELTRRLEVVSEFANSLSQFYTGETVGLSAFDRTLIYLGIAVLVIDAVILLLAYPELKKRSQRGWDLLFLGAVVNLLYALVSVFIDGRGVGSFIWSLVVSAFGFYLLYQVRDRYTKNS